MSSITYMQGAASEEHLAYIRERLDEIHHDGLTMTDKSLEEFLFKQRFHPMPFVRFTERPDICAAHLLEGHIAIIVDTSPSVILVPAPLFHHLQHAEEYRQAPLIGTFVRFTTFICGCDESCSFAILVLTRNETTVFTRFLKLYWSERHWGNPVTCSASNRGCRNRSTSYGGYSYADTDVDRDGICCSDRHWTSCDRCWSFHPGSCFICGCKCHFHICNTLLRIKHYDKNFQSVYSVVDSILGAPGFFLSIAVLFYYLCALRPMGVPYLWPAVPFFPQAMLRVLIRFPMTADAPTTIHYRFSRRRSYLIRSLHLPFSVYDKILDS